MFCLQNMIGCNDPPASSRPDDAVWKQWLTISGETDSDDETGGDLGASLLDGGADGSGRVVSAAPQGQGPFFGGHQGDRAAVGDGWPAAAHVEQQQQQQQQQQAAPQGDAAFNRWQAQRELEADIAEELHDEELRRRQSERTADDWQQHALGGDGASSAAEAGLGVVAGGGAQSAMQVAATPLRPPSRAVGGGGGGGGGGRGGGGGGGSGGGGGAEDWEERMHSNQVEHARAGRSGGGGGAKGGIDIGAIARLLAVRLPPQRHTCRLACFDETVSGADITDWLTRSGEAVHRKQALLVGQELLRKGVLQLVHQPTFSDDEDDFEDDEEACFHDAPGWLFRYGPASVAGGGAVASGASAGCLPHLPDDIGVGVVEWSEGYEGGSSTPSFVLYTIEICVEAEKWETPKRYREFQELHKQLQRLCPSGGLPTLPKKQKVSLSANYWDEEFLSERRDALDCYLRAVTFAALARPAVLGATVARFLDPRVVSLSRIDR